MSEESKPSLTREQLLDALDTEIESIAAAQKAAGQNNWAILVSLGALVWMTIDAWIKGNFAPQNVLLLTVAITMVWDLVRQAPQWIDSSLTSPVKTSDRFWSISWILGCARTNIIFSLLLSTLFLVIVWQQDAPLIWILRLKFIWAVFLAAIALIISLIDSFPEISDNPKKQQLPERAIRILVLLSLSFPVFMCIVASGIVWVKSGEITAFDVRLSLLASALIYLVNVAVDSRIPAIISNTYRSIRQNLAFGRINIAEAQSQVDILFIGKTLTQALQPHYNKLLIAIESIRTLQTAFHTAVEHLEKAVTDLRNLGDAATEEDRVSKTKAHQQSLLRCEEADTQLADAIKKAKKLMNQFEDRQKYLNSFAPRPPNEIAECNQLRESVGKMLDLMVEQRKSSVEKLEEAKNIVN